MLYSLDPRSPTPLYAQIASRIRVAVATGDLASGAALPSVRALSAELRVNPATVVQAYRQLESEGIVEMRQGSGSFIAPLTNGQLPHAAAEEARRLIRELLERASRAGVSLADLQDAWRREIGGHTE